jgi:hypothetical protein
VRCDYRGGLGGINRLSRRKRRSQVARCRIREPYNPPCNFELLIFFTQAFEFQAEEPAGVTGDLSTRSRAACSTGDHANGTPDCGQHSSDEASEDSHKRSRSRDRNRPAARAAGPPQYAADHTVYLLFVRRLE